MTCEAKRSAVQDSFGGALVLRDHESRASTRTKQEKESSMGNGVCIVSRIDERNLLVFAHPYYKLLHTLVCAESF